MQHTPLRVHAVTHRWGAAGHTASFHNFKSQNFKLSVSNPKNKHVAYVSVLSQISNCQGLGRKNKFEMLKTDRMYVGQHMLHTLYADYARYM